MPTHTARSRSGGAETWRAGPCRGSTGRSPAAPLAGSLSCRRALVKARPTEACGKVGPGCRPVSAARPRYISRWRQQNGATLLACRRACASRAAATRGREGFSGDGVESHTRTHTRTHTHTHTHAHTHTLFEGLWCVGQASSETRSTQVRRPRVPVAVYARHTRDAQTPAGASATRRHTRDAGHARETRRGTSPHRLERGQDTRGALETPAHALQAPGRPPPLRGTM